MRRGGRTRRAQRRLDRYWEALTEMRDLAHESYMSHAHRYNTWFSICTSVLTDVQNAVRQWTGHAYMCVYLRTYVCTCIFMTETSRWNPFASCASRKTPVAHRNLHVRRSTAWVFIFFSMVCCSISMPMPYLARFSVCTCMHFKGCKNIQPPAVHTVYMYVRGKIIPHNYFM